MAGHGHHHQPPTHRLTGPRSAVLWFVIAMGVVTVLGLVVFVVLGVVLFAAFAGLRWLLSLVRMSKARRAALALHGAYIFVANVFAGTSEPRRDDPDKVMRGEATVGKSLHKCIEIGSGEGGLEFGQRAQRQAKPPFAPIQNRGHLAAASVDRHHMAPKASAPADSSASSNATSPS